MEQLGLMLNGKPLEGPSIYNVNWSQGQIFREHDDPDRMHEPWENPTFVKFPQQEEEEEGNDNNNNNNNNDNNGQESEENNKPKVVTVQEINLSRNLIIGRTKESFARVLYNVLNESECAELLSMVNRKGFTPALLNIGYGRQQWNPDVRDGYRVVVDSPELAKFLLHRIRPHLPERIPIRCGGGGSEGEARFIELNERCRFLCYHPGQQFQAHADGCYRRSKRHGCWGDFSHVTLHLYLHDIPVENGGATTFLGEIPSRNHSNQPMAGSVLMFTQELVHEGSLVKKGIKYTMRTEAMYRKI